MMASGKKGKNQNKYTSYEMDLYEQLSEEEKKVCELMTPELVKGFLRLSEEEKKDLIVYATGVDKALKETDATPEEILDIERKLIRYEAACICEEHYRIELNRYVDAYNMLVKNPYNGPDKNRQREYIEEYQRLKDGMDANREKLNMFGEYCDTHVEEMRVADQWIHDMRSLMGLDKDDVEVSKAPKFGPTVNKR